MKIVYSRNFIKDEENKIEELANSCGILKDIAALLYYRKIDTAEKVKEFYSADKTKLINPFLLDGIKQATERIASAKNNNESVLVFGDYDADGISAVSVLFYAFKEFGITPRICVPEREDGYGLNTDIVKSLNAQKKIDLIITVDCGISDREEIEKIKGLGIDVIVTDHHEPPENLPDCVFINPKIKGQKYPFSALCGAGVAYKLAVALIGKGADKYLDFVALATVADSMELIGENRIIVKEGVKLLNLKPRSQFKYLVGTSTKTITAQTLAFNIAPRVNAGGRMGDANSVLRLFTTDNENEIYDLAVKINEYNLARQAEFNEIYLSVKERLKTEGACDRVLIFGDEKWKPGFVGLVAARLAEEFYRPVILFGGLDDIFKGSARSVENVNIFEAVESVKDLLVEYGGHSQAAGIAIEKNKFSLFKQKINEFVSSHYGSEYFEPKFKADWKIDGKFSLEFAREIEKLEPFGMANKRPVFAVSKEEINGSPLKNCPQHISFKTDEIEMLEFGGAIDLDLLALPIEKTLLFEINLSVFNKRESLKGYVRNVIPNINKFDDNALSLFLVQAQIHNIPAMETTEPKSASKEFVKEYAQKSLGYGTAYILSDLNNLKEYPFLDDLPIEIYRPKSKNLCDCILVAPFVLPDGYKTIIYLDKPIAFLRGEAENYCVYDINGLDKLKPLSFGREEFAKYFSLYKDLAGKAFINSAEFCLKHDKFDNGAQFVFCLETFLELGFFYLDGGVLKQNFSVKRPLTDSKIYSTISSIGE